MPARREVVAPEGGDEWGKLAREVSMHEGVRLGGGEHGAAEGSMGCGQGGGGAEEVSMGKRWGEMSIGLLMEVEVMIRGRGCGKRP